MRPSSRFVRSARRQTGRARRAFRESTAPGHRLMDALGSAAYFFTLTTADLDASIPDAPSGLYDQAVMTKLFTAVKNAFDGPVYAVVEVGKGSAPGRRGRLHVHAIAHRDDGPQHITRDTARCTPVYDVLGLYRYLNKVPEQYSLDSALDAAAARVLSPSGRLPNTRRHLVTVERLAWVPSTYCPKDQTPPAGPQRRPIALRTKPPRQTPNRHPRGPLAVTWSRRVLVRSTPTTGPPRGRYPRPTTQAPSP